MGFYDNYPFLIFDLGFFHKTNKRLTVFSGNNDYISPLGTNILPLASCRAIFHSSRANEINDVALNPSQYSKFMTYQWSIFFPSNANKSNLVRHVTEHGKWGWWREQLGVFLSFIPIVTVGNVIVCPQ